MKLGKEKHFNVFVNPHPVYRNYYKALDYFQVNFKIGGSEALLSYQKECKVYYNNEKTICFIVEGVILGYESFPIDMIKDYHTLNEKLFEKLNGTFGLVVIDTLNEKIFGVTDRLNSRKLFISKTKESIIISDSVYSHPQNEINLDLAGIGWNLVQGSVLNNHTLFQNIRLVEQASFITIHKNKIISKKYWNPVFTNLLEGKDELSLIETLYELIQQSLKTRKSLGTETIISLSGGYDVSVLLGLMAKEKETGKIHAFSYYSGDISNVSDCAIAKIQADLYGINHTLLKSFNNDICSTIYRNAIYGEGIANFVDEVDFWDEIYNYCSNGSCEIVTGEEFFGWSGEIPGNKARALNNVGIKNLGNIAVWKSYFPNDTWHDFVEIFKEEISDIQNQLKGYNNLFDFKSEIVFRQCIPFIFMPWREFYSNRNAITSFPLLDNRIIEFIFDLPVKHRMNKSLFIKTANSRLPELFSIPRASKNNNFSNWGGKILDQKDQIIGMLDKYSPLDTYLPAKNIRDLLLNPPNTIRKQYITLTNKIRKAGKIIPIMDNMIGLAFPLDQVSWERMLLRILVMREFLSNYYFNNKINEN